jgi:glycosyltransferase involved in cell wall biosynthesis
MRKMCEPYYGDRVTAWPVGIDTEKWAPSGEEKDTDFLLYDKVRWEHDAYEHSLIQPVKDALERRGLTYRELRYGYYEPSDLAAAMRSCRAALFLCEHETQGLAYQQMLSSGVPILAWDRGGFWQDPEFYPERAQFEPVSTVPYWDDRCGLTFPDAEAFEPALEAFLEGLEAGEFSPRDYILENLTLEKCAAEYVRIAEECTAVSEEA